MTPEMQARVFEPFYTTKFTGRGLGLAVVHGIVRGHRGGVRVESAPQLGSTFSVAMPAIAQPAEPLSRLAPLPDTWRSSGVVLIADDEDLVREVADTMLRADWLRGGRRPGRPGSRAGVCGRPGPLRPGAPRPDHADHDRRRGAAEIRQIRPDVPVLIMSGYNEQDTAGRSRPRTGRRVPPQAVLPVDLTRQAARGPRVVPDRRGD